MNELFMNLSLDCSIPDHFRPPELSIAAADGTGVCTVSDLILLFFARSVRRTSRFPLSCNA
jgi:hypothetical protein